MGPILPLVLLPFGDGLEARVGQGPMSDGSHRGVWAWDFLLDEGEPVIASAGGRVIRVVDDRTSTGENRFELANQIFIDHGGGVFSTYVHHQARTARVREGEIVSMGQRIASVGRTGTIVPHIHFDVRGPSWEESRRVRFRTVGGDVEPVAGASYRSRSMRSADRFVDSEIRGPEFEAGGVRLDPGGLAFRIAAQQRRVFRGNAAEVVSFWLWSDGTTSQYSVSATPDERGRFALAVEIPDELRGGRWYRIGIADSAEKRTLPVLVE